MTERDSAWIWEIKLAASKRIMTAVKKNREKKMIDRNTKAGQPGRGGPRASSFARLSVSVSWFLGLSGTASK